jgi:tRNA threonylcarbamoyl adenosine modification protein (Sua5/YciO/YrdC/YwlC family)
MPLRHERLGEADPDTLRRDVVDSLQRGELSVLPTETVYGLAVLPSQAAGVRLAQEWKGRPKDQPFTWHIADVADLEKLEVKVPLAAQRLIERYWPGPLTLILPGKDGQTVGVRLPAHEFTRSVIRECGEPLWMTSVNASGEPPLTAPDDIAAACQGEGGVAILVDDGASPLGVASTIVRSERAPLEVLREGILSREEVLTAAADLILFVCTGNTCRSPLAEAMARQLTSEAMGIPAEQVLARGICFSSAGTAAAPGSSASDGSQQAGAEIGIDLSAHISQPIAPSLWRRAMAIYCLSDSHRRALLAEAPEIADKVELLRPDGLDIADPFGGDLSVYQQARDEMHAAVKERLGDWWP